MTPIPGQTTDSLRPQGYTTLMLTIGNQDDSTQLPVANVHQLRIWDYGALTAFDADGAILMHLTPGTWWSFGWN